jgi:hypothetical protein
MRQGKLIVCYDGDIVNDIGYKLLQVSIKAMYEYVRFLTISHKLYVRLQVQIGVVKQVRLSILKNEYYTDIMFSDDCVCVARNERGRQPSGSAQQHHVQQIRRCEQYQQLHRWWKC